MSTLRTMIDDAQRQLSTYRHPNVSDVSERLSAILQILSRGSLEYDRVDSISEEDGNLVIGTTYSLRGCTNNGEYEIPIEIIDADDPLDAARRWVKQQALNETEQSLKQTKAELDGLPQRAIRLQALVAELQAQAAAQRQELA